MSKESHAELRLKQLHKKTKKMRHDQEQLFREKKTSPARQALFNEARKSEQAVDEILAVIEFEKMA